MDSTSSGAALGWALGAGILVFVVILAVIGLITGAIARFLLPGPDPMSLWATAGFGIAGSFIGGLIGRLAVLGAIPTYVLSVGGAMLVIWFFTRRAAPPPVV
jgi:uncharacterized membrane protein YeaQ/YmgE (transglycosylase-associated protein family)